MVLFFDALYFLKVWHFVKTLEDDMADVVYENIFTFPYATPSMCGFGLIMRMIVTGHSNAL